MQMSIKCVVCGEERTKKIACDDLDGLRHGIEMEFGIDVDSYQIQYYDDEVHEYIDLEDDTELKTGIKITINKKSM